MTTPGTVLPAGSDAPPTTPAKAWAALIWALIPVVLSSVILVLQQLDVLWPGAPSWVKVTAPIVVALLAPVLAAIRTYQTPNKLLLPVTIGGTP